MGAGKGIHVEGFAGGGRFALELLAIPGGFAYLKPAMLVLDGYDRNGGLRDGGVRPHRLRCVPQSMCKSESYAQRSNDRKSGELAKANLSSFLHKEDCPLPVSRSQ